MSKYTQFEVSLKEYLYEKLHKSHIEDLLNEGARVAIFSVSLSGSFKFTFSGGHATWGKTYKNLDSFYATSEMLEDLEGLGYAFVSACVSAENSVKGNKPKAYYVELIVKDSEVYDINITF